MASCTKQKRKKKDQKLGQDSCSLTIDDVQKNVNMDNMLKSNLGYKKMLEV
jgi:hypothetical protein